MRKLLQLVVATFALSLAATPVIVWLHERWAIKAEAVVGTPTTTPYRSRTQYEATLRFREQVRAGLVVHDSSKAITTKGSHV